MDFNIDVRKKQLQSLDEYITSSKESVQSLLEYLGWSAKKLLDKDQDTVCSVNANHTVALKNIDVHMRKCLNKTLGYESDILLSVPIDDPSVIKLDPEKKIDILNTASTNNQLRRAAWNGQNYVPVTPDEQLALYNYCIENTKGPPPLPEFNIQVEDKKAQKHLYTQQELLAKERDAKRRRTKYRSVHTGRGKSYTEVMREVITNQMEQYKDYVANKAESNAQIERPSSSVSRHSNHSAGSVNKKDLDKSYKDYSSDTNYKTYNYSDYSANKAEATTRYFNNGRISDENICTNDVHPIKRDDPAVSHDSNYSGYSRKTDTEYEKYKSRSDADYSSCKRNDGSSNKRPYKDERRSKDYEYDYRRSREKRERYHKSERRY